MSHFGNALRLSALSGMSQPASERKVRLLWLLMLFLAIGSSSFGQPEGINPSRSDASRKAQFDRDEARWADLEAQRRVAEGDYDGAVQAHQQAEQALQEADRQQTDERLPPQHR